MNRKYIVKFNLETAVGSGKLEPTQIELEAVDSNEARKILESPDKFGGRKVVIRSIGPVPGIIGLGI